MTLRTRDDYRSMAEHFAAVANDIKFPDMAERLRELARHYAALADGPGNGLYSASARGS
jgi:hypothetical protein